jgi:predicted nucleotidyltransferase
MVTPMGSLMTETTAAVVLVLDETDGATLTQLARATGKPVSTIQRAIESLTASGVVARASARGAATLAEGAPRRALRDLAAWQVGRADADRIRRMARTAVASDGLRAPSTISNPTVRAAWPAAIEAIVAAVDPARILLFGSQARGDARPDSDVDLLVVFDRPVDKRELRVRVGRALAQMPFGKDILVATTGELEHPMPGTALVGAVRDGVLVYER